MLSIITVTYNDAVRLEETLISITGQSDRNFEYVIVDGGSKDKTTSLIKKFENGNHFRWISEPDHGLYDAMNKGVRLSAGQYLLFLNAGDTLVDNGAISRLNSSIKKWQQKNPDGFYGDVMVSDSSGRNRIKRSHPMSSLYRGLPSSHQAMIVKRDHCLEFPFPTSLRLAADFAMALRIYNAGNSRWFKITDPFSIVTNGGISDISRFRARKEIIYALWKFGLKSQFSLGIIYHCFYMLLDFFALVGKRQLGHKRYNSIKSMISRGRLFDGDHQ